MTILGWESKYREILKEFGYSRKEDSESCKLLDSLLPNKFKTTKIKELIENKPVFVVGAGPSLPSCIPVLKKYSKITKIVADGATRALVKNTHCKKLQKLYRNNTNKTFRKDSQFWRIY